MSGGNSNTQAPEQHEVAMLQLEPEPVVSIRETIQVANLGKVMGSAQSPPLKPAKQ